jgi:hypothetical protein
MIDRIAIRLHGRPKVGKRPRERHFLLNRLPGVNRHKISQNAIIRSTLPDRHEHPPVSSADELAD